MTLEFDCEKCPSRVDREEELKPLLERYLFSEGVAKSAEALNLFESYTGLRLPAKCEITSNKLQSRVDKCGTNGSSIDTSVLFVLQLFFFQTDLHLQEKREIFTKKTGVREKEMIWIRLQVAAEVVG
jgi:hypothetical protein